MDINLFVLPVAVFVVGSGVIGAVRIALARSRGGAAGLAGRRDGPLPPTPSVHVMTIARSDGLIAGIREYRRETGLGLAIAKQAVEDALR
jgi:ribosomal protein L7/L12